MNRCSTEGQRSQLTSYAQRRSLYRWERGEVKVKHLISKGQSLPPCGSMYMKQVAID